MIPRISFLLPLLAIFLVPVDHNLVTNGGAVLRIPSDGTGQFRITTDAAVQLLKNYRSGAPAGSVWGEFFGRDAVTSVLNQPGCTGLRIYFGKKSDSSSALVIVGVDSTTGDILPGITLETGLPCPPFCDTKSILGH